MNKIAVIGVGTAGISSLAHLLSYLPEDWEVYSIYNPGIDVLGIGESSGIDIPAVMNKGTGFNIFHDAKEIDATLKFGMKYVGWREHDIFMHIVPPSYGMQFDNIKLRDYALKKFPEKWGDKFKVINGTVESMENKSDHVHMVIDGENHYFNYVIDCMGYPKDFSDYVISEVTPTNSVQVNLKKEPGDWGYTYSVAHENGWMFGVPTLGHQGWGYLYNDKFAAKEDALKYFSKRDGVAEESLNLRELKFKSYYAKTYIDGRIIKNGNRAMFLEPLEALAGHFYSQVMKYFFDYLTGQRELDEVNSHLFAMAEDMESYMCYVYHGGSNYDTPFWQWVKETCGNHIKNDDRFQEHLKMIKSLPNGVNGVFGVFGPTTWNEVDKQFGYGYLK